MSKLTNHAQPSSFQLLGQIQNPQFVQNLEQYCSSVTKKQRQKMKKECKVNFFIEEEQNFVLNKKNKNYFENNLSNPSVNMFDFEQPKLSFQMQDQNYEFKNLNEHKFSIPKSNSPLKSNDLMQQEDPITKAYFQNQKIKNFKMKNQLRNKRLRNVLEQISDIKFQLQEILEEFEQNIKKPSQINEMNSSKQIEKRPKHGLKSQKQQFFKTQNLIHLKKEENTKTI